MIDPKKSVLVTGASGGIGRAVCCALEQSGWKVWRQTRKPGADCIVADLCDSAALCNAASHIFPSAVIHLAAVIPGAQEGGINPHANEKMIESLKIWMQTREIATCILASSCSLYGTALPSCVEDMDLSPSGWYAEGKLSAERIMADGPWRPIALRIAAPYGPHPRIPTVVHRFLKMAAAGEDITLWGSGERTQHFVHVADVAASFLLALESDATGVFNISGHVPVSMTELAAACIKITRSRSQVSFTGHDPQEAYRGFFPWDKACAAFGYIPRIDLERGLKMVVEAEKVKDA